MGRIKQYKDGSRQSSPLPEIGKIKVGKMVEKNGKTYPTSLDYFRATGKYADKFHQVYGEEPNRIEVVFVSDDLDAVCNEQYQLRDKRGDLFGYGDGERFHIWNRDEEDYVIVDRDEFPNVMEKAKKRAESPTGWKRVLTLRFVIPKIRGVAGVWKLVTKGKQSSVPNIIKSFDFVRERAGTVVNIPFDLEVEKVKSQKPGTKSVFPVIKLIPNVSEENMQILHRFLTSGHSVNELPGRLTDEKIEDLTDEQKALEEDNEVKQEKE